MVEKKIRTERKTEFKREVWANLWRVFKPLTFEEGYTWYPGIQLGELRYHSKEMAEQDAHEWSEYDKKNKYDRKIKWVQAVRLENEE